MRRSAAPSFRSSAKRLRFLSPLIDSASEINKENDLLNYMEPDLAQDFNLLVSSEPKDIDNIPCTTFEENIGTNLRSTKEILQLILETDDKSSKPNKLPSIDDSFKSCNSNGLQTTLHHSERDTTKSVPVEYDTLNVNSLPADSEGSVSQYSVLWCKRSAKKHKKWEGDGVLIVKNRSAVLKNSEGEEIGRGIGYKLKDVLALEEGSRFFVGSKECEIQNVISSGIFSEKEETEVFENSSLSLTSQQTLPKNSKRTKPCM